MAIRKHATMAVHQVNINPTNLRLTKIVFPESLKEQLDIEKIIYKKDAILSCEVKLLENLKSIKTALMQDLLTGKVQVTPDAEDKELAHA